MKSAKKLVLNQVKNLLYEIGLVEKAPKAKRKGGLTAMLLTAKVVINPVVDLLEKKGQNIRHAAQLLGHVKKKVEVNLGAKKPREVKNNEN